MRLTFLNINSNLWLLLILFCFCENVLPRNPYKNGEFRANPKGCIYLRCDRGDQCVNRKFWCKNPPCPNMLYCAKSRMESLKGPSSCESVRCSKGFVCLLRVRHCQWDEPCQQRIARCVSEREYYDGPASCVDFKCPSGLSCILRESLCEKPPCKLVKSCADTEDVKLWHKGCKSLGCLSEHECFLRRPARNCRFYPCKHTPDCSSKSEEELEENEQCRGWVCPKGEECSALSRGPCERDICRISRSCHGPLMVPINVPSGPNNSWRDDVKLTFYSKVDNNFSTTQLNDENSHLSGNNKMLQSVVEEDKKMSRNLKIDNLYDFPSNKATNYSRPTSSRTSSASPDITSGQGAQPTVTSLSTWLNHLKLKTGVDAIEAWIEMAEKKGNCGEFLEWLESVKEMLGPDAYNLWIEEVRTMTVTSPAFQKWLPPQLKPSVPQPSVSPDFLQSVRTATDENNQTIAVSPKEINHPNDEDNGYPRQGMINNQLPNSSRINNDNHDEESSTFLPKNDTIVTKPDITTENPVKNYSEIPILRTSVPITDWQQFNDRDPRRDQNFLDHRNFGNMPWINQALFPGFNPVNSINFQQPPNIDPRFLNHGSSAMDSPFNQGSMDRRFLQSSEIPDQRIPTNWTFQQASDKDLSSIPPNYLGHRSFVPINRQQDQFSMDQRFIVPGEGLNQQFQSISSFPDRHPYFLRPDNWQSQFGPSFNTHHENSMEHKFLKPEESPEHKSQTNFSFQPSLNIDPNFFRNSNWQENLFPPPNLQWPMGRDLSRLLNRRNLESLKLSRSIASQSNENDYKANFNNSTQENEYWMKYFLDEFLRKYKEENIGSFPTNDAKFRYESWPHSSYRRRNFVNLPHLPTKPEDDTYPDVQFHYDNREEERSGSYKKFPWLIDPRLYGYYLHLRDRDTKNIYDKNNREATSALSSPSRTNKVDADALSPLPKAFFIDSQLRDPMGIKFHSPNTYLQDRLSEMVQSRPLPLSTALQRPAMRFHQYHEDPDVRSKINRPEVVGGRKIDFSNHDHDFNAPGRSIAVIDPRNSALRTSLMSVLQKFYEERSGFHNETEKKIPISTTMTTPVESTSTFAPLEVIPITEEYPEDDEVDDYHENMKNIENYDDAGIYPLLLSLQGYIETSKDDEMKKNAFSSKNSTILPVYKVEDPVDEEENYENNCERSSGCTKDSPLKSDEEVINLFRNEKYGGTPDFPNNLKNVFDVEAEMVMKNTTGESDVKIKDIKWDYDYYDDDDDDDEEDKSAEDPSRFFVQSQGSTPLPNIISNNKENRSWNESSIGSKDENYTENDSYDDVVYYEDEIIPEDTSNYNFEPENNDAALDDVDEEILEEIIDSLYDDPEEHKRFKKNRP